MCVGDFYFLFFKNSWLNICFWTPSLLFFSFYCRVYYPKIMFEMVVPAFLIIQKKLYPLTTRLSLSRSCTCRAFQKLTLWSTLRPLDNWRATKGFGRPSNCFPNIMSWRMRKSHSRPLVTMLLWLRLLRHWVCWNFT